MARRQTRVTITEEGRDKGKCFVIDEMPASRAEKWATQALLAVSRAGINLPDEAMGAGMAGVAVMGLTAIGNLAWHDLEPLMEEMWTCIRIAPDEKRPEVIRALVEDDIEEVSTRLRLRAEVLELHTGFSITGLLSTFQTSSQSGDTATTPTFPAA